MKKRAKIFAVKFLIVLGGLLICSGALGFAQTSITSELTKFDRENGKLRHKNARVQIDELVISAKNLTTDLKGTFFEAVGSVQANTPSVTLEATQLLYDAKIKIFSAENISLRPNQSPESWTAYSENLVSDQEKKLYSLSGSIRIFTLDSLLTADSLEYDSQIEQLTLLNASLYHEKDAIFVQAKKIIRHADGHLTLEDAIFSNCDPSKPAWEIHVSESTVYPGNLATLWHVRLRSGYVPLLYFPFYPVPIRSDRHSGFLAPKYSNRSSADEARGYNNRLVLPYFWNIRQDQDLTLSLDALEKRGYAYDLDYRYAWLDGMNGSWKYWYLDENKTARTVKTETLMQPTDNPFPKRYRIDWQHRQRIGSDTYFYGYYKKLKDNEVERDYFDSASPVNLAIQKKLVLEDSWARGYFSVSSTSNEQFLKESRYDLNTDKITHLNTQPQVRFNWHTLNWFESNISTNIETEYTQWKRLKGWKGSRATGQFKLWFEQQLGLFKTEAEYNQRIYQYRVRYLNEKPTSAGFNNEPDSFGWQIPEWRGALSIPIFWLNTGDFQASRWLITPKVTYRHREDVDQRQALNTSYQNNELTNLPADYETYKFMFDQQDRVLSRQSIEYQLELLYQQKDLYSSHTRDVAWLRVTRILDLKRLRNEASNQNFKGPVIPEKFQETELGDPELPWRVETGFSPYENIKFEMFQRYYQQINRMIETKATLTAYDQSRNSISITHHNNEREYQDLAGILTNKQNSYIVNTSFDLWGGWSLNWTGLWDLRRREKRSNVKTNGRLLKNSTYVLTYNHCCYQLQINYKEDIKSKTEDGQQEEFIDRKFQISFSLGSN